MSFLDFFRKDKKNEKIDSEDLDADLDLDFDTDFDFDFDQPDNRDPVTSVKDGAKDAIKSKFSSPGFYRNIITKALPDEYQTIDSNLTQGMTKVSDAVTKSYGELKPKIGELSKKVDDLIPQNEGIIRKFYDNTLGKFKDDVPETSKKTDYQEEEITNTLKDIFEKNQEQEVSDQAREDSKDQVKETLDSARFNASSNFLLDISNQLGTLNAFNSKITTGYQRKSLELQFRSYFVQSEILKSLKEKTGIDKTIGEKVVKNTGLPDSVKIRTSERFKETIRDRFSESMYDGLFAQGDNLVTKLGNILSKKVEGFGNTLKDGIDSTLMGMDLSSSMGPVNPYEIAGGVAGDYAGDAAGSFLTSKLQNLLNRNPEFSEKLMARGLTAENMLDGNADAYLEDFISEKLDTKSEDYEDDSAFSGTKRFFKETLAELLRGAISKKDNDDLSSTESFQSITDVGVYSNRTDKSITDIIPGYLARILREVTSIRTGEEAPLVFFDYKQNKFRTGSSISKGIVKDIKESIDRSRVSEKIDTITNNITEGSDNITTDTSEEIRNFVSDISNEKVIYDKEHISKLDQYKNLSTEAKEIVNNYLEKISEGSGIKGARFEKSVIDLKRSYIDPRGILEQNIKLGYGDELAEEGLVERDEKGNFVFNREKYKEMTRERSEEGFDSNVVNNNSEKETKESENNYSTSSKESSALEKVKSFFTKKEENKESDNTNKVFDKNSSEKESVVKSQNSTLKEKLFNLFNNEKEKDFNETVNNSSESSDNTVKETNVHVNNISNKENSRSEKDKSLVEKVSNFFGGENNSTKESLSELIRDRNSVSALDNNCECQEMVVESLTSNTDRILESLSGLTKTVKDIPSFSGFGVNLDLDSLVKGIGDLGSSANKKVSEMYEKLKGMEIPEAFKVEILQELMSGKIDIKEAYKKAESYVKDKSILDLQVKDIPGLLGSAIKKIGGMSFTAGKEIFKMGKKISKLGYDSLKSVFDKIAEGGKKLYDSYKDTVIEGGKKLVKTIYEFGKDLIFEKIPKALKVGRNLIKDVTKKVSDIYYSQDVYVKGEEMPRLYSRIIRNGGYILESTGKPIKTFKDITGTILDTDGNVVLSMKDIQKGLTDKDGKDIETPFEKLALGAKNFVSNGINRVKNFFSKGFSLGFGFGRVEENTKSMVDILFDIRHMLAEKFSMTPPGLITGNTENISSSETKESSSETNTETTNNNNVSEKESRETVENNTQTSSPLKQVKQYVKETSGKPGSLILNNRNSSTVVGNRDDQNINSVNNNVRNETNNNKENKESVENNAETNNSTTDVSKESLIDNRSLKEKLSDSIKELDEKYGFSSITSVKTLKEGIDKVREIGTNVKNEVTTNRETNTQTPSPLGQVKQYVKETSGKPGSLILNNRNNYAEKTNNIGEKESTITNNSETSTQTSSPLGQVKQYVKSVGASPSSLILNNRNNSTVGGDTSVSSENTATENNGGSLSNRFRNLFNDVKTNTSFSSGLSKVKNFLYGNEENNVSQSDETSNNNNISNSDDQSITSGNTTSDSSESADTSLVNRANNLYKKTGLKSFVNSGLSNVKNFLYGNEENNNSVSNKERTSINTDNSKMSERISNIEVGRDKTVKGRLNNRNNKIAERTVGKSSKTPKRKEVVNEPALIVNNDKNNNNNAYENNTVGNYPVEKNKKSISSIGGKVSNLFSRNVNNFNVNRELKENQKNSSFIEKIISKANQVLPGIRSIKETENTTNSNSLLERKELSERVSEMDKASNDRHAYKETETPEQRYDPSNGFNLLNIGKKLASKAKGKLDKLRGKDKDKDEDDKKEDKETSGVELTENVDKYKTGKFGRIIDKATGIKKSVIDKIEKRREASKERHARKEQEKILDRYKPENGLLGDMFSFFKSSFGVLTGAVGFLKNLILGKGLMSALSGIFSKIPGLNKIFNKGGGVPLGKDGKPVKGKAPSDGKKPGLFKRGAKGFGKNLGKAAKGGLMFGGAMLAADALGAPEWAQDAIGYTGMASMAAGLMGTSLTSIAVTTGSAALSVGATVLGGIASILTAPVVITGAAIAGLAYGGYKLYQYYKDKKIDEIDKVRLMQYGVTDFESDEGDETKAKVLALESYLDTLQPAVKNGTLSFGKEIDPKKVAEMMEIDPEDEEDQEKLKNFLTWYQYRFQPYYAANLVATREVNKFNITSKISGLKDEEKILYLDKLKEPKGKHTSKLEAITARVIPSNLEEVKAYKEELRNKLSKKKSRNVPKNKDAKKVESVQNGIRGRGRGQDQYPDTKPEPDTDSENFNKDAINVKPPVLDKDSVVTPQKQILASNVINMADVKVSPSKIKGKGSHYASEPKLEDRKNNVVDFSPRLKDMKDKTKIPVKSFNANDPELKESTPKELDKTKATVTDLGAKGNTKGFSKAIDKDDYLSTEDNKVTSFENSTRRVSFAPNSPTDTGMATNADYFNKRIETNTSDSVALQREMVDLLTSIDNNLGAKDERLLNQLQNVFNELSKNIEKRDITAENKPTSNNGLVDNNPVVSPLNMKRQHSG